MMKVAIVVVVVVVVVMIMKFRHDTVHLRHGHRFVARWRSQLSSPK